MNAEDKTKAMTNPSAIFKSPSEVVWSEDLSRSEKSAILKQWELDARQMQVASEEGMSKGEHSLFAEVKSAQNKLDVAPLPEKGAPSKAGP